MGLVAALTFASGVVVAVRMRETLRAPPSNDLTRRAQGR
jgi:hypothetical protein